MNNQNNLFELRRRRDSNPHKLLTSQISSLVQSPFLPLLLKEQSTGVPGFEPETLVLETRMLPVTPHSQASKNLITVSARHTSPSGCRRQESNLRATFKLQWIYRPLPIHSASSAKRLNRGEMQKSEPLQLVALKRLAPLHILWLLLEPYS